MAEDLELAQFKEIFISEAKENLQVLDQSLVVLEKNPLDKDKINAIFRVAHTIKGMAATMGFEKITELSHHMEDVLDKVRTEQIHLTTGTVDLLFSCLDTLGKLVSGVESSETRDVIDLKPLIVSLDAVGAGEEVHSQQPAAESYTASVLQTTSSPSRTAMAETIRVNVSHLDNLMNLVGEMVIHKGRLEEISQQQKIPELEEALSFFDRLGMDLQAAVLKTRMVPVSHIFDRYPRMVRDTARKLDKEAELEISGSEIEIDRMLLEQINEPLVHILRNAMDHGLETKEERIKTGKPPQCKISLTARKEQSAVAIEVKDDGRGMSAEKLKAIAVERGILTQESADRMSEKETYFLICDPRFSSAKEITDISGRGVGMDVVKSAVESVNGVLLIDSQPGKGSAFTLKLPLSLAIIRVLLVKIQEETYAFPLSNILEIVSIQESGIKTVGQKEVIVLRDEVLPIVKLDEKLGTKRETIDVRSETSNVALLTSNIIRKVVVIEVGDKKVGFAVTDLIGRREVVVKTLHGLARQAKGFSGATILGDGRVVLILDVGAWV